MPATFSYANVLHAIGQLLDQTDVKSIAIHEEEEGLIVEGFDGEGQLQVQARYDIPTLYELVSQAESRDEEHVTVQDEGLLRRFLADHSRELIGVAR